MKGYIHTPKEKKQEIILNKKPCFTCGVKLQKKSKEMWWEFEIRKTCSRDCYKHYLKVSPKTEKQLVQLEKLKEYSKKIGGSHKGHKHSEKTKQILSDNHKGIRFSPATEFNGSYSGEKHYLWKGNDVGYTALHDWVRLNLGTPDTCENCLKNGLTGNQIHWANKSGKYLRDLEDWSRLCAKCHWSYDRESHMAQYK